LKLFGVISDIVLLSLSLQRYKHLFDINGAHGSFYLQSKVFRAKEALEEEYKSEGKWKPEESGEAQAEQGGNKAVGPGDDQRRK